MTVCIVCRREEGDIVCQNDRSVMARMIAALPGRYERLSMMLVPGQGGDEPRVSSTPTKAKLPARAAALSLLAGGNEQVSGMLHPQIRRWKTQRTAIVSRVAVVDGVATIVSKSQEITEYHREYVVEHDPASGRRCRCGRVHDTGWKPVQIPDDDQIGTLPPREWLDTQVRHWRVRLGDHVPPRTIFRPRGRTTTPATGRLTGAQLAAMFRSQAGGKVYAALHAVEWFRQQQVNARLGLYREVPASQRTLDPLQDEIEARFGEPPRSLAMSWDVKYLLTHLDVACDRGDELGIDTFHAELQAVTAEIQRVLREDRVPTWIGRCPSFIADPDSGVKHPCGAGLWQEAGWAQVTCPRCHSTHDTRGPAGRTLSRQIRTVWPVDRRRRYSADDMAATVPPRCPDCGDRVIIEWREVTGTDDARERRRWWQPKASRCEAGCRNAGRVL